MDENTTKITINIDSPFEDFKNHLENNERIIFSGPFGIGKTYFLKDFFKKESDDYITIALRPINYAVSDNDDIFQLIKYDIIYELLKHSPLYDIFDSTPFPENVMREYFLASNLGNILDKFVLSINKIDKSVLEFAKYINDICNEYESFRRRHIDAMNEFKTIETFDASFRNRLGSIYENDFISELINSAITKLKAYNKKVVLIIDDVDRIDPDHIFRLINLFGAHLDIRENENKFLFDKTILVCDIKNIKGIFRHKYGAKVDFDGYIDKFHTDNIFYYNNTSAIINWIDQNNKIHSFKNRSKSSTYTLLFTILSLMSKNNLINIRSLIKIKLETNDLGNFLANNNKDHNLHGLLFLDIFFILRGIFQDSNSLIEKLHLISENDDNKYGMLNEMSKSFDTLSSNNASKINLIERFFLPILTKSQAYKRFEELNTYTLDSLTIEYHVREYDVFLADIKSINGQEPRTFSGRIPLWSFAAEATSRLAVLVGVEHY